MALEHINIVWLSGESKTCTPSNTDPATGCGQKVEARGVVSTLSGHACAQRVRRPQVIEQMKTK